ncbi:hypothetical protein GS532_16735 [Rhodococcus hoagii]|nr:hypothetical protein [Prescottella equi]
MERVPPPPLYETLLDGDDPPLRAGSDAPSPDGQLVTNTRCPSVAKLTPESVTPDTPSRCASSVWRRCAARSRASGVAADDSSASAFVISLSSCPRS